MRKKKTKWFLISFLIALVVLVGILPESFAVVGLLGAVAVGFFFTRWMMRRVSVSELEVNAEYVEQKATIEKEPEWLQIVKNATQLPTVVCDNPSGVIVFDVETTGLSKYRDELLQVSIIDGNGRTLLNTYVKPYKRRSWNKAEEINHISPEMVKNAPHLDEITPQIRGIFESANTWISYNGSFDLGFLDICDIRREGIKHIDVMAMYKSIAEKVGDRYRLVDCAEHYGYRFEAHDSLNDCKATLYCYKKII